MKILIVEDKTDQLYILEALLKSGSHEVVSAFNGKQALEKLRSESADMIITDILMPVMDGFQLCREVKADVTLKHIPFIFYTATYTDEKDKDFALKLGADRFLQKPMDPDDFLKIIKEMSKDLEDGKFRVQVPVLGKTEETFELYSKRLVTKLEKKMLDLEKEVEERKQTEKALRESEAKYRLHFENVSDVIYSIDPDYRIFSVSSSVEKALGYKPEELIGKPFPELNILSPEYLEQAFTNINQIFNGERDISSEYEFICKDGTIKIAEVNANPFVRDGKIIAVISVARDITERKRIEEEKKQLIIKLQQALDEIKTLKGILPLCSYCKKIRIENDEWENIDVYISERSEAQFSHGVCPECIKKYYPDINI